MADRVRKTRTRMGRVRRPRNRPARPPRLWQPRHHRRHRTPTWWSRELRLAGQRIALHFMRSARREYGPSNRHAFKTQQFDGVPVPAVALDPDDKRVLLVEDEPLVSMMLADMLSAFGHKVDGPYHRFSDAILAAKSNNLQAGILDVNLAGEKTYAVADILTDRKIPFAFVTGYGPDSIIPAFAHAPLLQKPIEAAKLHALLQQIVR
jgi:CheY-like chemotaxis protein